MNLDALQLQRLRSRDPQLVAEVIDANTSVLLRTAWGLGLAGSDAEEIVQATFVAFLESADRFEGRSTVRTYLIGILYHKAQQKRREREIPNDPIDEVFDSRFGLAGIWRTIPRGPEEEALTRETGAILQQCLDTLPTAQRMAFFLREVEGESPENICNVLSLSDTHLRVLLFRARNKLRECVQRRWSRAPFKL